LFLIKMQLLVGKRGKFRQEETDEINQVK